MTRTGRFFSGLIFTHPALKNFDYYLRLDDDSLFLCDIEYDLFKFMRKNHYKYAWIIYFWEWGRIAGDTLWSDTLEVG